MNRDDLLAAARQLVELDRQLAGDVVPLGCKNLRRATTPPAAAGDAGGPSAEEKAAALREIEQEVRSCSGCLLCKGRQNVVFGEGNPDARVVFVGEAPGEEEDKQGRPFVGRAGQLLTKMITSMGLRREDVYICNVLKCRPPNNRAPLPDEVAQCRPYLLRQLKAIRPRVIVTLGNPATHALLETTTGIMRLRGHWADLPGDDPDLAGIRVMPTFHPAYVLRSYTVEVRGQVWDDLKKVMEELGLPMPDPPAGSSR